MTNITPSAGPRKAHDLQSLFDSSIPYQRAPCPICRAAGGDSTGDHLAIGDQHVVCHRDPEHGRELWRELRNGATDLPPKTTKPNKRQGTGRQDLAVKFWESPASSGPISYMKKKRIGPSFAGSRLVIRGQRAVLVFPLRSADEWESKAPVQCVVAIEQNGDRRTYGRMTDVNDEPRYGFQGAAEDASGSVSDQLVVAEGFSTAATVHRLTGQAVVITAGASRIPAVAKRTGATAVYADHDEAGARAAVATGLPVFMPSKFGHDWNDSEAKDESQAAEEILRPASIDMLHEIAEGDVPKIIQAAQAMTTDYEDKVAPDDLLDRIEADAWGLWRAGSRQILIATYAMGLVYRKHQANLRAVNSGRKGKWESWLEGRGDDKHRVTKAMQLARHPWAEVAQFQSVSAALDHYRVPRTPKEGTPPAVLNETEGDRKELQELKAQLLKAQARIKRLENEKSDPDQAKEVVLLRESNERLREENAFARQEISDLSKLIKTGKCASCQTPWDRVFPPKKPSIHNTSSKAIGAFSSDEQKVDPTFSSEDLNEFNAGSMYPDD